MAQIRPFVVVRYETVGASPIDADPPEVSGLTITIGSEVETGGDDPQVYRFPDGHICVPNDTGSRWTTDNGVTWDGTAPSPKINPGPMNGGYKQAICMGGHEYYNLHRTAVDYGVGGVPFRVAYQRSTNTWATITTSDADVLTDGYVPLVGDAGDTEDGPLFHHSMLHINHATYQTMALVYGTRDTDTEPMDGHPVSFDARKFRTEAVFTPIGSKGAQWENAVAIFSTAIGMITRGTNPDSQVFDPAVCHWQVQEGAAEGSLTRRKNGHIWAFVRTGGRQAGTATVGKYPIYPTPMLMAISTDEGFTWDTPRQIPTNPIYAARHGNNPNSVTLGNGVTILTFGGPGGGWVCFAKPGNDPLFEGFTQLTTSDAYTDIVPVGFQDALVFYSNPLKCKRITVQLDSEASLSEIVADAMPYRIASGDRSRINMWCNNVENLKIFGGQFENGGSGTALSVPSTFGNVSTPTDALTATTTYRLEWDDTATSSAAAASPMEVTVTVS